MRVRAALATMILLAGCSSAEEMPKGAPASAETKGVAPDTAAKAAGDAPGHLQLSLPQLAYSYSLAYLLPSDSISTVQDQHRVLCEEMGSARCQLLALERGVGTDRGGEALLKMRVASAEARRFQILLDHDVAEAGGRTENAKIATEEVSKQIIDTEARIRQRELLVARLTEALRTRAGTPSELVAAERSVTEAQEELDRARSWLGERKGRVAMSEFDIRYAAIAPSATARGLGVRLGEAAQGSGAVFLMGLDALLSLLIYLLPWLLLLALPVLALRTLRKRREPAEQG